MWLNDWFLIRAQVDFKNRNWKIWAQETVRPDLKLPVHPCHNLSSREGFFNPVGLIVSRLCTRLLPSYAQRCPSPRHPAYRCALLHYLHCERVVRDDSNKMFFGCEWRKVSFIFVLKEMNSRQTLTTFLFPGQQKKNISVYIFSQHFLKMSTAVKLVSGWIFLSKLVLAGGMGLPM